jgi:molybdopterin converting factor small subunit
MKVRVRYFAQLRDVAGLSETEMEVREGATVAELLTALYDRAPALRSWDKSILLGSGVEFVGREHALQPNEEIAVMPPVQGG